MNQGIAKKIIPLQSCPEENSDDFITVFVALMQRIRCLRLMGHA